MDSKPDKKYSDTPEEYNNTPEDSPKNNALGKYAYFSGIGFQMFGIIGAFTYAGYRIDKARESDTPIWTALLSLTGVIFSIYIVIRAVIRKK